MTGVRELAALLMASLVVIIVLAMQLTGSRIASVPAPHDDEPERILEAVNVPPVTKAASSPPQRYASGAMDIVVAYYRVLDADDFRGRLIKLPRLKPLAGLRKRGYVYIKHANTAVANVSWLAHEWRFPTTFKHLANVGREGHTYLSHIVEHYDDADAAEYVFFTQENIEYRLEYMNAHLARFRGNCTGFLGMDVTYQCSCARCYECTKPAYCASQRARQPEIYALVSGELCAGGFLATMHGEFIVSQRRIHARPKAYYEYLLGLFEANASHFLHGPSDNAFPYNAVDPPLGYVMEPLWSVMFNCHRPSPTQTCKRKHLLKWPNGPSAALARTCALTLAFVS